MQLGVRSSTVAQTFPWRLFNPDFRALNVGVLVQEVIAQQNAKLFRRLNTMLLCQYVDRVLLRVSCNNVAIITCRERKIKLNVKMQ